MIAWLHLAGIVAVTSAAAACWLALPRRPGLSRLQSREAALEVSAESHGRLIRYRWQLSLFSGVGVGTFASPPTAWVLGIAVAIGTWVFVGQAESQAERSERSAAARDLVPFVGLFAAALEAGAPPGRALEVARLALPGPASDRLTGVAAELQLGGDPQLVWTAVADDPVLGPLGRAVARAEQTGAPIALIVCRLADELAERARAEVEDRARAVGVKAAVPLGLCLLPSFLLIGIVPVAAGLLQSFT